MSAASRGRPRDSVTTELQSGTGNLPVGGRLEARPTFPPKSRSEFLGHLFSAVSGVGNQLSPLCIDYEVEDFERDLADQVRDVLRNFDHVEILAAAHQL